MTTRNKRKVDEKVKICQYKRLRKNVEFDINTWISPSSLRNYIMNDPILDWIKMYGHHYTHNIIDNDQFTKFIMNKGVEFENEVYKLIKKKIPNIVQVSNCREDIINPEKAKETEDLMMKGVEIIYQGVLHNPINKTYGCADLIVRSDIINKIVPNTLSDLELYIKGPRLRGKYHYRVIDIKYHTLNLKANGLTLLNSGNINWIM